MKYFHTRFSLFVTLSILFPCFANETEPKNAETILSDVDASHTIKKLPKSQSEICREYDKKVLLNIDEVYFYRECSLHLVGDSYLMFMLLQDQKISPLRMSSPVFASLPIGKPYELADYYKDFPSEKRDSKVEMCEKYNNTIVSSNNFDFYVVQDCRKRKINNFSDLDTFNEINKPIQSISFYTLNLLPDGKPFVIASHDHPVLRERSELDIRRKPLQKHVLCKGINGKVTAFFQRFYYVENCTLMPIANFNIALQMEAQKKGGIDDLSIDQMLGLRVSKEIESDDVLKKLESQSL
jgi:hypothetical protein